MNFPVTNALDLGQLFRRRFDHPLAAPGESKGGQI
jgi:hypothetical protein